MTAPAIPLATARPSTPGSRVHLSRVHRVLGAVGMLGSPAFLFMWITGGPPPSGPPVPSLRSTLLDLAYLAGWACSAVGLRRLRATGRGRGAALLFGVQLLGFALAASQELQDLRGVRPLGPVFYGVTDMAWPLSHVFMLAIFAAVRRARVWTDWRRWTPLACGLALPVAFAAAAIGGRPAMGAAFGPGTAAAFFALGLAVCTASVDAPAVRP